MPKSTYAYVAQQLMTLGDMMNGDEEQLQKLFEEFGVTDKGFTKDTTMGEFENAVTIAKMFSFDQAEMYNMTADEMLKEIKEMYKLPEDVTGDTLFRDVKVYIYNAQEEKRLEQEQAKKDAEKSENAN